jgi:hypothetical protein
MRSAYWITEAKDTHSEYLILTHFLWQQWLRERVSALRCTYLAILFLGLSRQVPGYDPRPFPSKCLLLHLPPNPPITRRCHGLAALDAIQRQK